MSDAPTPAPEGKKKGKLPVIAIVAIMLFAGGFFGMKMKGGGAKKEPEIKLGKIVELDEKLVNLTNETTFLRTTIGLHLKEGFEETKFKEVATAVDDAVVLTLKSKSARELESVNGLTKLKRELAAKINAALESAEPPKDAKDEKKKKKKSKEEEESPEDLEHPDWDSQTGPVLKVYFKAFAIQ